MKKAAHLHYKMQGKNINIASKRNACVDIILTLRWFVVFLWFRLGFKRQLGHKASGGTDTPRSSRSRNRSNNPVVRSPRWCAEHPDTLLLLMAEKRRQIGVRAHACASAEGLNVSLRRSLWLQWPQWRYWRNKKGKVR